MTIRIWPMLWDRHLHAEQGAPMHREAVRALIDSGYRVIVYTNEKRLSDTDVAVSCDSEDEVLACLWLCPGVDDDGPAH